MTSGPSPLSSPYTAQHTGHLGVHRPARQRLGITEENKMSLKGGEGKGKEESG